MSYFEEKAKELQLMVGYNASRETIAERLKEIALDVLHDSNVAQEAIELLQEK